MINTYYYIPFAYLIPPEKVSIPNGKTIELPTQTIPSPKVSVDITKKPDLPYFISTPPNTPVLTKPLISFLPISIGVPDLENLQIPSYSTFSGEIPSPSAPDYMEKPEVPSEIDYEKFKFTPFGNSYVYIPFYKKIPTLKEIEKFMVEDFSFGINRLEVNSLEHFEVDLLDKFDFSFEAPLFMKTDIYNVLGLKPLFYFEKETSYVRGLISEFLEALKGVYSLSSLIEKMRVVIETERDKFSKFLSEKERKFFLFKFFSSVFDAKVKMRERWLSLFFDNISQQLKTTVIKNESDFILKREEWLLNEQELIAKINHIGREAKNFNLLTALNRDLRQMFAFYNEIFVILTMVEALNIERDRLLVEKLNSLSRVEEAKSRETMAQSRKQVLEEKETIYEERINYLNSEIERLTSVLKSLQAEFEARWGDIKARYSSLMAKENILEAESGIIQVKGEANLINTYFRGYSEYLDTYLRLNKEFLRASYETRAYSHRLEEDIQRSLLAIHRAGSFQNNYVRPIFDSYFNLCEKDRECAYTMASSKLTAQITESFS